MASGSWYNAQIRWLTNSSFARELVPWVRSHYRVDRDPARTVISSQSNGGYAAAHAALRHPDVFGGVLSQSGSFWLHPSVGAGNAAYDADTG